MKAVNLVLKALLLALVLGATRAEASDPMALYARVDKVVLEPSPNAPDRIQIWGVFALARPDDPNAYLPPARGYLYFVVTGNTKTARKEWADLQAVAGTGQIVAFGSRFEIKPRLRRATERVGQPDRYVVSSGLTKVRGRTDYPVVRALVDFKD